MNGATSGATIDYSALAAQSGALGSTPPPVSSQSSAQSQTPQAQPSQAKPGAVDYGALAAQSGAISSAPATTGNDQPGWLDREIPLDSYAHATESGVQSIARGIRSGVKGTLSLLDPRPQNDEEQAALGANNNPAILPVYRILRSVGHTAQDATELAGAIHDINQSSDPLGYYLKAAQNTAGEGAGQALVALGTEGLARGVPVLVKGAAPAVRAVAGAAKETAAAVRDAATPENIATTVGGAVGTKLGAMAGQPLGGAAAGAAVGKAIGKAFARRIAARAAEESAAADAAESASTTQASPPTTDTSPSAPTDTSSSAAPDASSSLENALSGQDTTPASPQETPQDFMARVAGNGRAQVRPNASGQAVDAATGKPLEPGTYRVFENGKIVAENPTSNAMFGTDSEGNVIDLRTPEEKAASLGEAAGKPQGEPQVWQRGAKKGQAKTYKVFDQGKWTTVPVYK